MSTATGNMITPPAISNAAPMVSDAAPPISDASPVASEAVKEYESDVRKLEALFSNLNPLAKEFVPSTKRLNADAPLFVASMDHYNIYYGSMDSGHDVSGNSENYQRRRNGYNQGRRRMNERMRRAEREDSIRRTVYVSDIDHFFTEEHLADMFAVCGQVVDCRVCGDPHSILRFAFIEFADEESACRALSLGGTMLGYYPVRVLPSKTAILPVNPKFLPKSKDEREMVGRTVYCTNIDKKVTQSDVKAFFEQTCGEVARLRLLGDNVHSTRIAFVEFVAAQSAILALGCSGMPLGERPVRVSPSKTPVRPRFPRSTSN